MNRRLITALAVVCAVCAAAGAWAQVPGAGSGAASGGDTQGESEAKTALVAAARAAAAAPSSYRAQAELALCAARWGDVGVAARALRRAVGDARRVGAQSSAVKPAGNSDSVAMDAAVAAAARAARARQHDGLFLLGAMLAWRGDASAAGVLSLANALTGGDADAVWLAGKAGFAGELEGVSADAGATDTRGVIAAKYCLRDAERSAAGRAAARAGGATDAEFAVVLMSAGEVAAADEIWERMSAGAFTAENIGQVSVDSSFARWDEIRAARGIAAREKAARAAGMLTAPSVSRAVLLARFGAPEAATAETAKLFAGGDSSALAKRAALSEVADRCRENKRPDVMALLGLADACDGAAMALYLHDAKLAAELLVGASPAAAATPRFELLRSAALLESWRYEPAGQALREFVLMTAEGKALEPVLRGFLGDAEKMRVSVSAAGAGDDGAAFCSAMLSAVMALQSEDAERAARAGAAVTEIERRWPKERELVDALRLRVEAAAQAAKPAAPQVPDVPAAELLTQGDAAFRAGEFPRALQLYQQAGQKDSAAAGLFEALLRGHVAVRDFDAAVQDAGRLLARAAPKTVADATAFKIGAAAAYADAARMDADIAALSAECTTNKLAHEGYWMLRGLLKRDAGDAAGARACFEAVARMKDSLAAVAALFVASLGG
jgi:hypothetical protein